MRKLNTKDAFRMARLITKMNIREDVKGFLGRDKEKPANPQDLGIQVFFTIMDAAGASGVEDAIYELLGDITGRGAEDVASQELGATLDDLRQIAEENNLPVFFRLASGSPTT